MTTLSSLLGTNFQGDIGPQGEIALSTTVVVNPDTNPSVTDLTSSNTSLFTAQFSLPRAPNVSVGSASLGATTTTLDISDSGTNGDVVLDFTVPRAANVSIGSVSTGEVGSNATVTNSGTGGDVVLDFTIPRGDTGPGVTTGKAIAMAIVFG